jgi:AraC family transcriptional regulator
MSRSRFADAFRAAFGTTPALYVLDRRLTRARTLLETGPHDLSELAWTLGFASHSHLTTAFKARFGYPPREARRESRKAAELCSNPRV